MHRYSAGTEGMASSKEPHVDKGRDTWACSSTSPYRVAFLLPGYNERGPDEPPTSRYLFIHCPFQPPVVLSLTFLLTDKGRLPQTQVASPECGQSVSGRKDDESLVSFWDPQPWYWLSEFSTPFWVGGRNWTSIPYSNKGWSHIMTL